jgi:hypothetical protein
MFLVDGTHVLDVGKKVTVRLSKARLREIDGLADRMGTDRSGLLRRLVERGLHDALIDDVLSDSDWDRSPSARRGNWRESLCTRCWTSLAQIRSPQAMP